MNGSNFFAAERDKRVGELGLAREVLGRREVRFCNGGLDH
jgi:hypothetical protein